MLATILKSPNATATTISIIKTFAKVREINRSIVEVLDEDNETKQQSISNHIGELIGDLIMPSDEDLEVVSIEKEAKLKFFTILELSKKVIKKPKNSGV